MNNLKKFNLLVLISILFISTTFLSPVRTFAHPGMQNKNQKPENNQEPKKMLSTATADKDVYTCPMHPGVISEKPGKCPKCKMNLEKKEMVIATYTCPMHAEVVSDKPGKCPKCKMNLEKKGEVKTKMPVKM